MPLNSEKHRMQADDLKIRLYGDTAPWGLHDATQIPETLDSLHKILRIDSPAEPLFLIAAAPQRDPQAWLDDFAELCRKIRRHTGPHHTLLCHHGITPSALSHLYRCGLNDAVDACEDSERLESAVDGGRRAITEHIERLALLAEQQRTGRTLRTSQAELRKQVASTSAELASANRRLETANEQLTQHMSQLSLLYSFGRELSTARNWDQALEDLLKNLAEFVQATGAALVLRPASDAPYTPRKTYQWREPSWETVLQNIDANRPRRPLVDGREPDIFHFANDGGDRKGRVTAMPLNHRGICLGYLLLLDLPDDEDGSEFLPLLKALQLIIADEVASAQMLDRMRELSVFNSRVLETVHSGIWVIDEFARTIYCNRVGREMLSGLPADPRIVSQPRDGLGRGRGADGNASMAEFFRREAFDNGPSRELLLDGLLQLPDREGLPFRVMSDAGKVGWLGDGRLQRDDGSFMPVLVQSSHMHGRGRDEQWLVVVLEDQREAKRLVAEKIRADKLQSMVEMSSTLAHEIRNPLMGLSAQAELLAENLEPDDSRGRYIDVITREVERIDRTITGMLDFTRPCLPNREPTDLTRLMEDCAELVAPRAATASVGIDLQMDASGAHRPELDGDQIRQVMLNLLCNAVDASPKAGTVVLRVGCRVKLALEDPETGLTRKSIGTVIEVEDAGPGFAVTDVEAIFRPFFTTKSAGTGLGLSVSRKIIEAHGGALTALRQAGKTLFRIQLPELAAAPHSTPAKESS